MTKRRFNVLWGSTAVTVFVLFVLGTTATLVTAGVLATAFGSAVAVDYRGLGRSVPQRQQWGPFWQEVSPAMNRAVFGFFAMWGVGLVVFALVHGGR
jgi:hypothetical protein